MIVIIALMKIIIKYAIHVTLENLKITENALIVKKDVLNVIIKIHAEFVILLIF